MHGDSEKGELVRERVPELIEDEVEGGVETHVPEDDELIHRLCRQLQRSVDSFTQTGDPSDLADMLSLVEEIRECSDVSEAELVAVLKEKKENLGEFGVVLDEVEGVESVSVE